MSRRIFLPAYMAFNSIPTKYVELYFPLQAPKSLQITCCLFVLIFGQIINLQLVQVFLILRVGTIFSPGSYISWDKTWSPPRHLFLLCQTLSMLSLPKDVSPLILLVLVNDIDIYSVIQPRSLRLHLTTFWMYVSSPHSKYC